MDEGTLRLILLVVGIAIIAGIYLFDKFKKRPTQVIQSEPDFLTETAEKIRYQPRQRSDQKDELDLSDLGPMSAVTVDDPTDWSEPETEPAERFEPEPKPAPADPVNPVETPVQSTEVAPESEPEPEPTSDTSEEVDMAPDVIIQLTVSAVSGGVFQGPGLLDALTSLGFEYGDMGIFHCHDDDSGKPLFHLVNMVEPGTFPVGNMAQFETPGVCLFLQAAQVLDPVGTFKQMLLASEMLADQLAGEVLGANRMALTSADLKSIYDQLESSARLSV